MVKCSKGSVIILVKYLFLALLAISTAIHLYHSWLDDSEKRKYTKPFLLIFILLYYIFSADKLSFLLCGALVTSWIGDVLLIGKGNKWFTFGGIAFMLSHFLFIFVYALNLSFKNVTWWIVIPAAVIYYGISFLIVRAVKPTTPKIMIIPMYFYLLCNSTMNIFSLMQLLAFRNSGAVVAYIGAVLFFISDCTLYLVRYYKNENIVFKRHFTVMLTYVLGELFITQGILMLGSNIKII